MSESQRPKLVPVSISSARSRVTITWTPDDTVAGGLVRTWNGPYRIGNATEATMATFTERATRDQRDREVMALLEAGVKRGLDWHVQYGPE